MKSLTSNENKKLLNHGDDEDDDHEFEKAVFVSWIIRSTERASGRTKKRKNGWLSRGTGETFQQSSWWIVQAWRLFFVFVQALFGSIFFCKCSFIETMSLIWVGNSDWHIYFFFKRIKPTFKTKVSEFVGWCGQWWRELAQWRDNHLQLSSRSRWSVLKVYSSSVDYGWHSSHVGHLACWWQIPYRVWARDHEWPTSHSSQWKSKWWTSVQRCILEWSSSYLEPFVAWIGNQEGELDVQACWHGKLLHWQTQVRGNHWLRIRIHIWVHSPSGRQELREILRKSVQGPSSLDIHHSWRPVSNRSGEEHYGHLGERWTTWCRREFKQLTTSFVFHFYKHVDHLIRSF